MMAFFPIVVLNLSIKFVLFTLILSLLLIYKYVSKDFDYWKNRKIIYEPPWFPFGNLGFIMRKSFCDFFYQLGKKYKEPYVGVFLGHKPALVVQSAELARNILVKDQVYFQDRFIYSGKSDPMGKLNLFTLKNPVWSAMRKELSPIFTSARLRTLTQLMNINAHELVARIQREHVQNNKPVHLKELSTRYTSDTVGFTVYGLRTSALKEDDNPLWFISSNLVNWTFWRGFQFSAVFFLPGLASLMGLKFFPEAATNYVKKIFNTIVKERETNKTENGNDLIHLLLKIKENITIPKDEGPEYPEDLMHAQAVVFIFGAIETSSTTIAYCLHELSHKPLVQQKLFEEVDKAIKQNGKELLDFDVLLEMRYLNSCIQETLRKYTPVPHIDRVCAADYAIDEHLTVEKGTPVLINLEAIHHDEDNYPNPSEWKPERFSGVAADSDNRNFTFLPFGEGPHFCIGKRYGFIQVRAAIAQVVHKYRLEPGAPYLVTSDPYSLVLMPKGGGAVKFIPRQ